MAIEMIETRIKGNEEGNEVRNYEFEGMLAQSILEAMDYIATTKVNWETPLERLRNKVFQVLNANGRRVGKIATEVKVLDTKMSAEFAGILEIREKIAAHLAKQKELKGKLANVKTVAGRYRVEVVKMLKDNDVAIAALFEQKRALQERLETLKYQKVALLRSLKNLKQIGKAYNSVLQPGEEAELISLVC